MTWSSSYRTVEKGAAEYPNRLLEIMGRHAPATLCMQGNLGLLDRPSIGFCGSRKASDQGLAAAEDCASQAARDGVVVVSGNAAGVDLRAHRSALASGGATIFVLPEGIEQFSIRKTLRDLWDWERVLVVSQFEPGMPWRAYRAMERNKLIIGFSAAMIVIEAGDKGGTIDAGRATLDMGLPLFVAQYKHASRESGGNDILLSLGAQPLRRLRSTNRANMTRVWQAFEDSAGLVAQPRLL